MKRGLLRRLLFIAILVFVMYYVLDDEEGQEPSAPTPDGYVYEADPATLVTGQDLGTTCSEHRYFIRRGESTTLTFDVYLPRESPGAYSDPGFTAQGRPEGLGRLGLDMKGVRFEEFSYPVWRFELAGAPGTDQGWLKGVEGRCLFSDPREANGTISATVQVGSMDAIKTGQAPRQRVEQLMEECLKALSGSVPQFGTKRLVRSETTGIIAHVDVTLTLPRDFSLQESPLTLGFGVEEWPGADFNLGMRWYEAQGSGGTGDSGSYLVTGPAFSTSCVSPGT